MKLGPFLKLARLNHILIVTGCLLASFFAFQNCAKMSFSAADESSLASQSVSPTNPICPADSRPSDMQYLTCPAPNSFTLKAIQRYNVICQDNGSWSRIAYGDVDYSLCQNICDASVRPANQDNVACPAPSQSEIKGVQSYVVNCQINGTWTRQLQGTADYSACPKSCDPNKKPPVSQMVSCPAPYAGTMSGLQNNSVTCQADGTWSSVASGSVDYRNCPQSCNSSTMPAARDPVACTGSTSLLAYQNYSVVCQSNGTWLRTPTTVDTTGCPAPTCNSGTKPATSQTVACPAPFQSTVRSIQNYAVSCSGTTWVSVLGTRDDSQCPKSCTGVKPADGKAAVNCVAPNANQALASQSFTYVCNSTTGLYDKQNVGPVDYSNCPKSCTGTRPSDVQAVSCPDGFEGTAYQTMTVTCNTTTGAYTVTATNTIDQSSCSPAGCRDPQPATVEARACTAPFADRMDAKQYYSVSCQAGSWISQALGGVDTSSCPVNDCTGSVNPGSSKTIGTCGGGASGNITQTCQVSCSGRTFSQINCTPNDYSQCDCGTHATYDTSTKQCVPNAIRCSPSTVNEAPVACGAGYNGGTKFRTITTSCPQGAYGDPVVTTSDYNTNSCVGCPGPQDQYSNPSCLGGKTPVPNSRVYRLFYSCESGSATVSSFTTLNEGVCVKCSLQLSREWNTGGVCNDGSQDQYSPPPSCSSYADNGNSSTSTSCDANNNEYYSYTYTCVCQ